MKKEKLNPQALAKPPAPYSNMIRVSEMKEMIFLSGISAMDETGRIVGKGDILSQTKKVIANILAALEEAGAGRENILMTTTRVLGDEMDDFMRTGACNLLLEELDNPADTLVGVSSLAGGKYGALVEVTVVAAI